MKICPVCSREFAAGESHCPDDGVALVALATTDTSRAEELIGKVVEGRYRVERIVGKGGMGTVYAARHVVVGKAVALKVLRPGVDQNEGVLQRFIREAQTANLLKSRHIVEISDFGQLPNGLFFVVMELLEGTDLTRAMKGGALRRVDLIHVFVQIAEALGGAHDQGVVHRDLKPDNVFLVNEAGDPLFVKLLDFGIAKLLHGNTSGLTETGVILGTPYYMSPEQARAEAIDHRTDIYALGVMMYRAFTGRLPFIADSTMGVLTRHLSEAPEPPSKVGQVPPRAEALILRCMEKHPDRRPQSMREVAAELRALGAEEERVGGGQRFREDPTVNALGHVPASPSFTAATTPAHIDPRALSGAYPSGAHPGAAVPSGAHSAAASGAHPGAGASGAYPGAAASGNYPGAATSGNYPGAATSGNYPGAATSGTYPGSGSPSGAHAAAGSGPHAGMPGQSGAHPAAYGTLGSRLPLGGGAPPPSVDPRSSGGPSSEPWSQQPGPGNTTRGFATSQTSPSPRRAPMMVVGAVVMLAAGAIAAALFFKLTGSGSSAQGSAAASASAATAASAAPPATTTASTAVATAQPPSSAAATPTASETAAPKGAGAGKPRGGAPASNSPATKPTSSAAAPKRPTTDIRSPFD